MRAAVLGVTVLASLVAAVTVSALVPTVGLAQRVAPATGQASGSLIALSTSLNDQRQQVVMIDPITRVMGVYHIDPATGVVSLKSVRNVNFDLQMLEFNGATPLPGEVRAILEQR